MITSGPIKLPSGEWTLTLNTTNTGVMEVDDIGDIQYDFDLAESSDEITGIGVLPGTVSLSIDDTLDNLNNLYDILRAEAAATGGANPFVIDATITRRTFDGATQNFAFELAAADIGYNQLEGDVSLRLTPKLPEQSVPKFVGDLWNIVTPIPSYAFQTGNVTVGNCYPVGFVIDRFLRSMGGDTQVVASSAISNANFSNQVYPHFGQVAKIGFYFSDTLQPNKPMSNVIASMAGIEGAFYGSAFGVNFYVARGTETATVTLTFNDVVNILPQPVRRDIARISVSLINTQANLINTTNSEVYWAKTLGTVNIGYSQHFPMLWKGYLDIGGTEVYSDFAGANQSGIEREALAPNQESMARSLGVAYRNQDIMTIELQVLGIDLVRPWQTFEFDASDPDIPVRYKNKVFRPSSCTYDVKNDTATIRAYQI